MLLHSWNLIIHHQYPGYSQIWPKSAISWQPPQKGASESPQTDITLVLSIVVDYNENGCNWKRELQGRRKMESSLPLPHDYFLVVFWKEAEDSNFYHNYQKLFFESSAGILMLLFDVLQKDTCFYSPKILLNKPNRSGHFMSK